MTHALVYAAAFSRDVPATWYRHRDLMIERLSAGVLSDAVDADDAPIFTYGVAPATAIARVHAMTPPAGRLLIAQWTAIELYASTAFFLGEGVSVEAVKNVLSGDRLIAEWHGLYDPDSARVRAYELDVYSTDGTAAFLRHAHLVRDRVYVAHRWVVNDGDGAVDRGRFEIEQVGDSSEAGRGIVVFRPHSREVEAELVVQLAHEGAAVLEPDDPLLADLSWFDDHYSGELATFVDPPGQRQRPRLTIGRCHVDDAYKIAYGLPPLVEAPLTFLI